MQSANNLMAKNSNRQKLTNLLLTMPFRMFEVVGHHTKLVGKTTMTYDMKKHIDYQSTESGTILNIKLSHTNMNLLLETHQEVWSPTPFAIQMGELIACDNCLEKVVMDFASGSGFLSVIAGKNGAAKVIATDLNPKAIMMTKRNWALNDLEPRQIHVFFLELFDYTQSIGGRSISAVGKKMQEYSWDLIFLAKAN